MSIYGAFNAGLSAVRATQKAIEVTGANIANVNTEGYSKQRVEFMSQAGGTFGSGSGVAISNINRQFNRFTEEQLNNITERKGMLDEEAKYLALVEDVFQEGENSGVAASINDFFNAFSAVSSNPADVNERHNLVIQAQRMSSEFQKVDQWMRDVRQDTNAEIKSLVDDINTKLDTIKEINFNIAKLQGEGKSVNELLDERGKLVRGICETIDTSTFEGETDFQLLLCNLAVVHNNDGSKLSTKVDGEGNFQVYLLNDNDQPVTNITSRISSGKLAGAIKVRDELVPGYLSSLNKLAHTLVGEVNAVHVRGFGLDGVSGRNFFNPQGNTQLDIDFAASNIAVNPQLVDNPIRIGASEAAGELPYNNGVAMDLANLANKSVSSLGGQTFVGDYGFLLQKIGLDSGAAKMDATVQGDLFTQVKIRRQGEAGVSLDEEATNLVIYQKAFEGAARVINATSEMLDLLIKLGQ